VNRLEEVTTMSDYRTAKMLGHRRNIERYCRLLATELTDLERQYLHKRIAEEQAQLERLEKSEAEQQVDVVVAAEALGKRSDGQSHA
jgi:bacterioferritin (cytochrome b1)